MCRTYYQYFYRVEKLFVPYVAFSALYFPFSFFVLLCVAILRFLLVSMTEKMTTKNRVSEIKIMGFKHKM